MASSNGLIHPIWNFRMVSKLFHTSLRQSRDAWQGRVNPCAQEAANKRGRTFSRASSAFASAGGRPAEIGNRQAVYTDGMKPPVILMPDMKPSSTPLMAGGLLALLGFKDEEEEDELVHTIKLAVLSIQKGELDKAEQILHVALKMAQEKMEQQGITYIYDMLANIAYQKHEYRKAEKLFVETIRRLLASGKLDTDNAIVEISIKLADIYSSLGDYKKAEDGFVFSITTVQKKIEDKPEETDKDLHLLLGMASEMYAHHLLENSRLQKSKTYYESALEISTKFNGPKHPQTLVLLNDLGGVCSLLHEYEIATDYLKQAIELGNEVSSDDLPAFYCNMGAIYFKLGNLTQAGAMCKQAHLLATKLGNKLAEKDALACLDDIKKKHSDPLKPEKLSE